MFLRLIQQTYRRTGFAGQRLNSSQQQKQRSRARQQGLAVAAVALAGVGISYAAVPAYQLFCRMTGYGGTTQQIDPAEAVKATQEAASKGKSLKPIVVQFATNVSSGLPWSFVPTQKEVTVYPGL